MLTLVICLVVIVALFAVPALVGLATHNRLVALDQRCETAFADVDVHLKHRQNLIPALVETVRGFAKHESEILLGVTQARAEAFTFSAGRLRATHQRTHRQMGRE